MEITTPPHLPISNPRPDKQTIDLHKYLPLFKIIAMTIFVLLPFIGFYFGMEYQQKTAVTTNNQISYYDNLRKQCNGGQCCLSSLQIMEQNKYTLSTNSQCPSGFKPTLLRCPDSLQWCEPTTRASVSDLTDWQTYTNQEYGVTFQYPPQWFLSYERENEKGS